MALLPVLPLGLFSQTLSLSDASFHITAQQEEFQSACMQRLISVATDQAAFDGLNRREIVPYFENISSPCTWSGIECVSSVVREIHWHLGTKPFYPVRLSYLPPTVAVFLLRQRSIESVFEIRHLPHAMESFRLDSCEAQGTLDLPTLPPRMQTFIAADNFFIGTVRLIDLPATLRSIDIRKNEIQCIFVDNSSLPKELCYVYCAQKQSSEKLRCITADGHKPDARIQLKLRSRRG